MSNRSGLVSMAALASLTFAGALIVAGCGGQSTSQATPAQSRNAAAAPKCASANYRCTRLTIQNDAGGWIKVMADGRDQGKQTFGIGSGSIGAATGYWGAWGGVDMSGEIWDLGNGVSAYHYFKARNPQVGPPSIGFWNQGGFAAETLHTFTVGEKRTFALMENRSFDVTREPDSNHFIEFRAIYRKGQ